MAHDGNESSIHSEKELGVLLLRAVEARTLRAAEVIRKERILIVKDENGRREKLGTEARFDHKRTARRNVTREMQAMVGE